jgi:Spy/CpxP family protein refolding chaperone
MKTSIAAALVLAALATGASAQTPLPYAGMQSRPVKALSDQQIADLKAGRGMGLALAAELNGYPGPMHLLELADQLALTADQRAAVKGLFDSMKTEAIALGESLIAQETALDRLFAGRTVTPENLQAATAAIGETQARLRDTHLKYHLSTTAILQPQQLHRYAELRGYTGAGPARDHMMHKPNSN